jgi:hypothetical protein
MKGIYRIEDGKYIVYAKGTAKKLNKVYDDIKRAYPQFDIFMGDVDDEVKCVGSERKYSFVKKK